MNILIAPDSFKGSLPALLVAQAIAAGIQQVLPQAQIKLLPMADGGEGTLDALLHALHGERHHVHVTDLLGAQRQVDYGVLGHGSAAIAVLEAAQVVGLNLVGTSAVAQRSTLDLGELIRHCLDRNLRQFLIGLGGSGSNDGGVGLLAALGVRFSAASGKPITPNLEGLAALQQITWDQLDPRLAECDITLLSDVDNPLCGAQGATAIYGPQKGVAEKDVAQFDARLQQFALLGDAWAGRALSLQPGAGAAGGLGYALLLCGAQGRSGAEGICELLQLDAALAAADWVITGEGKSDAQTLHGKLPWVVAQHARRAQVPALLLSGLIEDATRPALESIFTACYALVGDRISPAEAMQEPTRCISLRAQQMASAILAQN